MGKDGSIKMKCNIWGCGVLCKVFSEEQEVKSRENYRIKLEKEV